jgi:hypothetical protein
VNDDSGEVGDADVPSGGLSPDRINGTAWTGANDGTGSGLDADTLDGYHASDLLGGGGWSLTGNAGTDTATDFLGTTDNQALEVRVNNSRILRLEPNATSPNILGGYSGNWVTSGVFGAVIGGGGESGSLNRVTDHYGVVGGGRNNQAGDNAGSVSNATFTTVGGGLNNTASASYGTVPGGMNNTAAGFYSFAAGRQAKANLDGCFVWGDNTAADVACTVANQFVARATGGMLLTVDTSGSGLRLEPNTYSPNLIGGYSGNWVAAGTFGAVIAGGGQSGSLNRVVDHLGTVGGGQNNQAGSDNGSVGDNTFATVAGGEGNTASGTYATIGGGGATPPAVRIPLLPAGGATPPAVTTRPLAGGRTTPPAVGVPLLPAAYTTR